MIVKIKNLVKRYGEVMALDHLNLEVMEGEIFGLLGPNGSGKTTAINCMLALLEIDKGEVELFNKKMTPDAYESKRNIGVVMQNVAVFEQLTVLENIDYFCGLYVPSKAQRQKLVQEAIEFVGLNDHQKFYPKKLSGGMLRRLNIACGIAHKPRLIILDEPTVGVDPQSRNKILEGIVELNRQGATIIYTSHYMEEVEQICSRIVIINGGKVIASGSKDELKRMIALGEKITVDTYKLGEGQIAALLRLPNIASANYRNNQLTINALRGSNNLENVLDFLKRENISFSRIYAELPTLNDVFLEMTGKALRD